MYMYGMVKIEEHCGVEANYPWEPAEIWSFCTHLAASGKWWITVGLISAILPCGWGGGSLWQQIPSQCQCWGEHSHCRYVGQAEPHSCSWSNLLSLCMCVSACMCARACVCLCACLWERERMKDSKNWQNIEIHVHLTISVPHYLYLPLCPSLAGARAQTLQRGWSRILDLKELDVFHSIQHSAYSQQFSLLIHIIASYVQRLKPRDRKLSLLMRFDSYNLDLFLINLFHSQINLPAATYFYTTKFSFATTFLSQGGFRTVYDISSSL